MAAHEQQVVRRIAMNADEVAIDGLTAQEVESLGSCVGRNQPAESYQDIVEKIRGHCEKLPDHRKQFWAEQCKLLGIELFPVVEPEEKESVLGKLTGRKKRGGSSEP
jgi:hypothetical protein